MVINKRRKAGNAHIPWNEQRTCMQCNKRFSDHTAAKTTEGREKTFMNSRQISILLWHHILCASSSALKEVIALSDSMNAMYSYLSVAAQLLPAAKCQNCCAAVIDDTFEHFNKNVCFEQGGGEH